MNADTDDFDIPDRSYLSRAAVSALALLGLAAVLAATLQLMGSAYGAVPLPVVPAEAAPLGDFPDGHELKSAADEIPLAEYYSRVDKDAADTTAVLDTVFILIASGCLVLLVYGAWLCLHARSEVPHLAQQPAVSSRTERLERSAVQA